jgi:hypothetical protein
LTNALATISDQDFITAYEKYGPLELARRLGHAKRSVYDRRESLENKYKRSIHAPSDSIGNHSTRPQQYPHRIELEVLDGTVLVGSDAHIWPGPRTTAMRGFIKFAKELKPKAVILNGDVTDFPQISKHDPIGWESWPTVQQEVEAAQDVLGDIEKASGRAQKIWTLGNHDARFEKRLAIAAPEYAKITGLHLRDHFPLWAPCWSTWINDDVVIKHRFKGGDHAPWNNVIKSGKHIVTAHLHSAKVMPFTDYNGTRYGVDDGCLADPQHKAFVNYTEDNPKNWRSGFCVLTFKDGKLLQPQLALVHGEKHIDYCGDLISV